MFTHTIPGPPPGAGAVLAADFEAGGVAAAEGVAAGVVFAGLAGVLAGADVGAGAEVAAGVPYQSFTPLCPLHAPRFVLPV